jgi:hypothetical protein
VSDIIAASKTMHDAQEVVARIPSDLREGEMFRTIDSIMASKISCLRGRIGDVLRESYSFGSQGFSVHCVEYSTFDVWESIVVLAVQEESLRWLATKALAFLVDLLSFKYGLAISASEYEWSYSRTGNSMDKMSSQRDAILSFFKFLQQHVPPELTPVLGRMIWVGLRPNLVRLHGISTGLVDLEESLIADSVLPSDIERYFQKQINSFSSEGEMSRTAAVLTAVRKSLLSDVNRVSVQLNGIKKDKSMQNIYVPAYVSKGATRIASDYFQDDEYKTVAPRIISLFIALRQPEFSDPDALDARHATLFFNDCMYLSLALAVCGFGLGSDISLLRSTASKSINWFIQSVKERAVSHLRASGGLLDSAEISDSEDSIYQCFAELSICSKEWKDLQIPSDVFEVWLATMIDGTMRKMCRLSVETARTAISKSERTSEKLFTGSVVVNSGLWIIHRKFSEEVQNMELPREILSRMVSTTVQDRIRIALTTSESEILAMTPLPDDPLLYGLSSEGFEAILRCNPILQGEAQETWSRLACCMMSRSNQISQAFQKQKLQTDEGSRFAAIFERH